MIIYPDIELRKGRCVNLERGSMDTPVVYEIDPVDAACDFAAQGAQWLHVVDLDAVFDDGDNAAIIEEIIEKSGCPVQVGGAIRTMDKARRWIDGGAQRVVIATAAVKYPHFVKEAATAFPDQVVVSVDARAGKVVVEGWREATVFTPLEFARQFEDVALAAIIYTDIDRDENAPESSMSYTTDLAEELEIPVIASGVVKSLDDISTLKYLPNISGAITSRALFGGVFKLSEAIEIAAAPAGATAPFV
ncbi:MAG: 1-(5-phosphoribosyl)-5-[(5-phosphoribosylamino)methylideneamino] imidazole-4-carboxamide isomerase [Alphaproteobacteria bacterium]|nr:1-(5-phosphoribosyl)-5-[(5-phosphoribosylamino)methylideneamino] imidazole-4-carboxamide isomerase [Alphaproteobacteria bacterium]